MLVVYPVVKLALLLPLQMVLLQSEDLCQFNLLHQGQTNTYLGLRWVWVDIFLVDGDLTEASLNLAKGHDKSRI